MKRSSAILAAVLLVIFAGYSYWVKGNVHDEKSLAYSKRDHFQAFTRPDMQGQSVDLGSVIAKNRLTWVNFWATWCGPCRREMPMMTDLYDKFHDKGLGVVAISIGEKPATVQQYLDDYPVPFPVLTDENRQSSQPINIKVLPTSFLVDSTGTIVDVGTGVQNRWQYQIRAMLKDE